MKLHALAGLGLLLASPLAWGHGGSAKIDQQSSQQCPPGQVMVPSEKQPVAGFDTGQPQPPPPTLYQGTGKVVPSAKTPKPSRIRVKEPVRQGTVPSAKTPK